MKDGKLGVLVDYRKPNATTVRGTYLLARTSEYTDTLEDDSILYTDNCGSGHRHLEIGEADRMETTFLSRHELFRSIRVLLGLENVPATFLRAVNTLLSRVEGQVALTHLQHITV